MTIHLLIVGQHDPTNTISKGIHPAAELCREGPTFKVRRCKTPDDLIKRVREVVAETFQLIDVLDIFDHGRPGIQELGDGVLFDYRGQGDFIARSLRPFLTTDARVRLLGCKTALFAPGQQLLCGLHQGLGGFVTIYGTLERIDVNKDKTGDFDEHGLKREREDTFLISSTEVLGRVAPDVDARGEDSQELHSKRGLFPGRAF